MTRDEHFHAQRGWGEGWVTCKSHVPSSRLRDGPEALGAREHRPRNSRQTLSCNLQTSTFVHNKILSVSRLVTWVIGVSGPFNPCKQETPTAMLTGPVQGWTVDLCASHLEKSRSVSGSSLCTRPGVRVRTSGVMVYSLPFLSVDYEYEKCNKWLKYKKMYLMTQFH